jgi:hypothetical protein
VQLGNFSQRAKFFFPSTVFCLRVADIIFLLCLNIINVTKRMNQKATSLTSLTFVWSQIFVTKVFEQGEILAVQHKTSPLTNGIHTHTHRHVCVDYITSELWHTSRKGREFALQASNIFKILSIDVALNKLLNKEKGRLKLQNNDDDSDGDWCQRIYQW